MFLVSSSGVPELLSGTVEPWKVAKLKGPPSLRSRVGRREVVLALERKDLLSQRKDKGRLKGFSGVHRHSEFPRFSKPAEPTNRNGCALRLVHCDADEDQLILLGFYCGAPGDTYTLIPEDAELLFEERFSAEGHPIIVFAVRMLSEDAVVVAGREKGNGSFVDVFTCEGCQRVPRRELQARTNTDTLEHAHYVPTN